MGSTTKFGWPYPDPSDLVRDAPEAFEDLADAIETTLGGTILQVVSDQDTNGLTTTSGTFQDTATSVTITPKRSNSVLVCVASSDAYNFNASGGVSVRIQNTTDNVTIRDTFTGFNIETSVGLVGTYTVNSTSARTIRLEYKRDTAGTAGVGARALVVAEVAV